MDPGRGTGIQSLDTPRPARIRTRHRCPPDWCVMRKYLVPVVLLAVVAAAAGYWFFGRSSGPAVTFRTEPATRGELLATISATGTLEPEDVIDVGSQVAGLIKEFGVGSDGLPIDYDSPVEAGTVLARIDDALFQSKVDQSAALLQSAKQRVIQSKAKVDSAKAKVDSAKANTVRSQADLQSIVAKSNQTSREWDRYRKVGPGGAISPTDYDLAQSNFESNKAAVGVAEAAVLQAKAAEADAVAAVADAEAAVGDAEAAVATAKAVLKQDEINLGYCTIKSSVKGTIIDRRVTLGQTVQSSFNTPSLFLIAKDLKRMKVWASVNEADISQVKIGQPVRFTVDAYPKRTFRGTAGKIRKNATNTQNVVVYTVEVLTENADYKLEPYMTANLQFEVDKRTDALLVPNAALRYRPSAQAAGGAAPAAPTGGGGGGKGKDKEGGGERHARGAVWVEEDGKLRSIPVKLGLTDGNMTEVVEGDLQPGAALVVGETKPNSSAADGTQNPFAPKMGGGKKG